MKVLFPVVLLCSGLVFSQKTVPADYQKIPEILDNPELLYPFIVPDKKYDYWLVLKNNPDPDKAIIYESQSPDFMTLNDPVPLKGFFQKCLGENCFSYVLACDKGRTQYFSDEQQLRNFIGSVDNLPEAILIANTYGYIMDTGNTLSSSYKIDEKHVSLYLTKLTVNSTQKESFLIKINRKSGKLEVKSNGTY